MLVFLYTTSVENNSFRGNIMKELRAIEIEERLKLLRINKSPLVNSFENSLFVQKPSSLKVKSIEREWDTDKTFTITLNNGELFSGLETKEEVIKHLRSLPIWGNEDLIQAFIDTAT